MNEYNLEQLIPLIAKLTKRYTSNDSSSIPYEKAKQIMASILFCMEEPDIEFKDEGNYLVTKEENLIKIYEAGLRIKKAKVNKAKVLYNEIKLNFNDYRVECYYDTVIKGFPEFFKWYNLEFNGIDHLLTLDYPLYNEISDLIGIDLIYEYLKRIHLEQVFLKELPSQIIYDTLQYYDNQYEELIFNIPKVIIRYAIGCILLNKATYIPIYNSVDIQALTSMLHKQPLDTLMDQLNNALIKVLSLFTKIPKDFYKYFTLDMENFARELKACAKANCLTQIFPNSKITKMNNLTVFKPREDIENSSLRELISKINELSSLSDKLVLLTKQAISISDMKELLKECFVSDEYDTVFNLFSKEEQAFILTEIKEKESIKEALENWEIAFLRHH